MLTTLHTIIGNFYGLDWAVLLLGVIASTLTTGGNLRLGMRFSFVSCICGLTVAVLAHQNGFVVYNALIMAINLRGIIRGDRRGIAREVQAANGNIIQQAVPVRASAR